LNSGVDDAVVHLPVDDLVNDESLSEECEAIIFRRSLEPTLVFRLLLFAIAPLFAFNELFFTSVMFLTTRIE
jgi:hypothetical protein